MKHHGFFLWSRDWLASVSVRMMSRTTRSIYIDLLCLQALEGSLPTDTKALARLVAESHADFLAAWNDDGLSRMFVEKGGRLENEKLSTVLSESDAYRQTKINAGKKGAKARWDSQNGTPDGKAMAEGMAKPMANGMAEGMANAWPPQPKPSPTPSPNPVDPPTPRKRGAREPFVPVWPAHLDTPAVRAAWAEWEQYRSEKRHRPYTPTGFARMVKPYAAPAALVRDIEHSIASNWQGIHHANGAEQPKTHTADTFGAFQ